MNILWWNLFQLLNIICYFQFQYMKQIGRCIPVLKSKQRAQSKGAFCFVYASATRLPSKEAVKTLTANSIARHVLKKMFIIAAL